MNYKEYIYLVIAGLFTAAFKLIRENTSEARTIALSVMVSILVVVFMVPALMDYFKLSLRIGLGLAVTLTLISDKLIYLLEKKLPKKLEDKIDKL